MSQTEIIDLMMNYPLPQASTLQLVKSLVSRISDDAMLSVKFIPVEGFADQKIKAAQWLSRPGYKIDVERVAFGVSGHQLLTSILLGFSNVDDVIACESTTYNGWLNIVRITKRKNVQITTDEFGMIPEALDEAAKSQRIWGVFLMPSLHNPCTTVMPLQRRQALIQVCRKHGLWAIDDDAYGFLNAEAAPSFAHLMPEKSFWLQSLTKPLFPSVKTALIVAPPNVAADLAGVLRATAHSPSALTLPWVLDFLNSSSMDQLLSEKRLEAERRQQLVKKYLSDFDVKTFPTAFHVWLTLPKKWTSSQAAADALNAVGVLVVPGVSYSSDGIEDQPSLRIALAGEADISKVADGLQLVKKVLS